ncbi:MAG: hypothetical protein Ct9H90mP13_01360 [Pseudomonadota bacterium]|nr:MAG: hypothetical protein Ct9H90mP13_01360 [Pseudomonadota bacterium]
MYCFKEASDQLLSNLKETLSSSWKWKSYAQVIEAQEALEKEGIPTYIWSVTSYNLLHRDFRDQRFDKKSYIEETLRF